MVSESSRENGEERRESGERIVRVRAREDKKAGSIFEFNIFEFFTRCKLPFTN